MNLLYILIAYGFCIWSCKNIYQTDSDYDDSDSDDVYPVVQDLSDSEDDI